MRNLTAGRTGRGVAGSGRGNHATTSVARECLPKAQAPEEHSSIEPLHDRVLVERLPQPQIEGRIIIPEVAQKPAILCKVIAVGPGRWEDGAFCKTAVKPGDTVLVPHSDRWLGDKLADWKQGEYVLITAGDIGAIVG